MRHLSYKSTSFARKRVPIHSETSDHGLKVVTLPFSTASFKRIMTFHQKVTRLVFSVNCLVDSGLTRLRYGDEYFREPMKSNFSM